MLLYSSESFSSTIGILHRGHSYLSITALTAYGTGAARSAYSATVGSHGHVAELGYNSNALNQYTSVSHSGKFWSLVRSDAGVITATSADSTVDGMTQVGNIHGAKISVNTDNNGRFISNAFMRDGNPVPGSVQTWVPPYSFAPVYDLDGNLTNDGRWSYTWDGENRLLSMIPTISSVTMGVPNVEVYFAYDYGSRRVGKRIVDKRHTPAQTKIVSYAYDDWNPVAIWERSSFASAPVLKQTYLWGIDVGSSGNAGFGGRLQLQQAGGVGGLISSTYYNSPSSKEHHLPGYDANGNIIAWSGGTGALLRKVDYDAFGNEVLVEDFGVTTKLPEFGFSTKIKDVETGLSYYGYRYYDPKKGRWISRDPIEEEGGVNLYGFIGNDGVGKVDYLGLFYSGTVYGEYLPFLRTYGTTGADNFTDGAQWDIGKWVVQTLGHSLTLAAMNHADGTIPGDWILNSSENKLAKNQTEDHAFELSTKKDFDQWLKDELYNKFYGKPNGLHGWSGKQSDFHYPKPRDGYTAFGDARIKVSGNVDVCKGWFLTTISLPHGVVELEDYFTFAPYSGLGYSSRFTPTAVGFRLQDSGYLRPFKTTGTWEISKSYTFW